ncbi:hypothetical protein N8508_01055, partial [bacterium]|nr:hypothetical protein [bacterium]
KIMAGRKDISKLVRKVITNTKGHRQTVYVKPKTMYHGSKRKFDKFDVERILKGGSSHQGIGFYFTEIKDIAKQYTGERNDGYLYEVNLKSGINLLDVQSTMDNVIKYAKENKYTKKLSEAYQKSKINPTPEYRNKNEWGHTFEWAQSDIEREFGFRKGEDGKFEEFLRNMGYDGIRHSEQMSIIFDPESIKIKAVKKQ